MEIEISLEGFELGGETYRPESPALPARLELSRTAAGHAMHLTMAARLVGPCMRCLEPSSFGFEVDSREVDQPSTDDEELRSPYVDAGELDLGAWAHDAIALALPQTLLCREDCAGLCPECGIALNGVNPAGHAHEKPPDPRWAKLREIQ